MSIKKFHLKYQIKLKIINYQFNYLMKKDFYLKNFKYLIRNFMFKMIKSHYLNFVNQNLFKITRLNLISLIYYQIFKNLLKYHF